MPVAPEIGGALTDITPPTSSLKSWVSYSDDHDFSVQNLPFGVVRLRDTDAPARCCMRIGDFAVDLSGLASRGLLPDGTDAALSGVSFQPARPQLGEHRSLQSRAPQLTRFGAAPRVPRKCRRR